ncbi:MAG: hypothetical protein WA364_28330 [Candidatus Nitrosopolaris sp.]
MEQVVILLDRKGASARNFLDMGRIKTDSPCCGYRLRTRRRNLKYKARLRVGKDMEEYKSTAQQRQKMHQQG